MFKVGDRVKMIKSCTGRKGQIGVIEEDDGTDIPYKARFSNGACEWNRVGAFEKVEEETSMKFKVGDKVKVKDSWFGFTGKVGVVIECDAYERFPYRVKFDVQDGEDNEVFVEKSLELAKQQFTKSDLKTGMGVVLRDGSKGHVLLGTPFGDAFRILDKETWGDLKKYEDDLTSKSMERNDVMEVYSTTWSFMYLTDKVFTQECIFKREEPKPEPTKMTMKEINEHFGKAIEIVE